MTEIKKTPIPQRLRNASSDHPYVAGAEDVFDDEKGKDQATINSETDTALEDRYTKDEIAEGLAVLIAGLPVSDGTDVEEGTAYIDSTDYTVKVKPVEEDDEEQVE